MTGRRNRPHQAGTYQADRDLCNAAANADPTTRCRRCCNLLPDCPPHSDGTPARWTAGHVNDAEINGRLAAECSTCAARSGGEDSGIAPWMY